MYMKFIVLATPRIMKNYTANTEGYFSFERLSAKSVQIVGYKMH